MAKRMSNTNPTKNRGELICSRRISISCSTCGTRRVTLLTNPLISHEWGKNRIVIKTNETNPWSFATRSFIYQHLRKNKHKIRYLKMQHLETVENTSVRSNRLFFKSHKQTAISWREQINFQWNDDEVRLLSWIFIVLTHWNNSPRIDMSPHSDTLSRFRANQSSLVLLNAAYLAEKQHI